MAQNVVTSVNPYPQIYWKNPQIIGGVVSLIVLIATAILASQYALGSLTFMVSCTASGGSLLSLITCAICSCCSQCKTKEEPLSLESFQNSSPPSSLRLVPRDGTGSLSDRPHFVSPSKPKKQRTSIHGVNFEPLKKSNTFDRLASQSFSLVSPGELQQRAYYCLLTSLLDPLIELLDLSPCTSSVADKIDHLLFFVGKEDSNYKFLLEESESDSIKYHLHCLFQILTHLVNPGKASYEQLRLMFFNALNKAFQCHEYQNTIQLYLKDPSEGKKQFPEMALLLGIGESLFTKVSLYRFTEEALFTIFEEGKNPYGKVLPKETKLEQVIESDYQAITANANLTEKDNLSSKKVKSEVNEPFYPLDRNHLASIGWQVCYKKGNQEGTPVCLQFGSLIGENGAESKIAPQFHLFLDACASQGKTLVLFFQQVHPPVSELAKNTPYQKYFFPFDLQFKLEESFKDKQVKRFKKILLEQRYKIAQSYVPKCKKELKDLISSIHRVFFKKATELSEEQKKVFEILVDLYFVDYMVGKLNGDFFYIQDPLIRAAYHFLSLVRLGKEENQEELRKFRVLIQSVSLITKEKPIPKERFAVLKRMISHLSSLSVKEKEMIQQFNLKIDKFSFALTGMLIEENSIQGFKKTPSEATSRKEYDALIVDRVLKNQPIEFSVPFYVQNFEDTNAINRLKQFKDEDLKRQIYFIDGQKPVLARFQSHLEALIKNSPKKAPEEIIQEILIAQSTTEDQAIFCNFLKEKLPDYPFFLSDVTTLYHEQRYEAITTKLSTWVSTLEDRWKILAISHQGALSKVHEILRAFYNFSPNALPAEDKTTVVQQSQKKDSTTCIHFFEKEGRKIVQSIHIFEIVQDSDRKVLYYLPTITNVYLDTGHATIICFPPQKPPESEDSARLMKFLKSNDIKAFA